MLKTPHVGREGFSLFEVLISITLVASLLTAVFRLANSSQQIADSSAKLSEIQSDLSVALERIQLVVRPAGRSTITPANPSGASQVSFQEAIGFANDAVQFGETMQLVLRPEEADPVDGIDNDGDGRVDEGELVYIQGLGTSAEKQQVLCKGVSRLAQGELPNGSDDNQNGLLDEPGFSIEQEGEVLIFRLTLEVVTDEGILLQQTRETAIRPRNP